MPNSTLPSSIKKTSSFVAGSPLPFYYRFISSAIREIYFSKISLIYPSRSQAENTHPKLILCSHRNSAFDGYVALKAFPVAQALASIQLLNSRLMRLFFTGIPVVRKKDRQRLGINTNTFSSPSEATIAHIKAGGDLLLFPVWDYVQRINKLGADYFLPNIAISLTQRSLYSALMALLKLFFKEEKYAHTAFDNLIAMSETKTGQVNAELWTLSRYVRQHPQRLKLITSIVPESIMQEIEVCDPHFHQQFTLFLANHGHRELDFDAYHPTWLDAPHIVLTQIKAMADLADDKQTDDPLGKKFFSQKLNFQFSLMHQKSCAFSYKRLFD